MDALHAIQNELKGLTIQHQDQDQDQQHSSPSLFSDKITFHPNIPNAESSKLAERTFQYFYSEKNNQFQARVKSHDTLDAENDFGYVVWPVAIMLHATADCLTPTRVYQAFDVLQEYWNPERHAFCAWKMFPNNEDIYYDDNAHAVQALISSFEITGKIECLRQAEDILNNFILKSGMVDDNSPESIPWKISNRRVGAACSTGPAVISALRIRNLLPEHDHLLDFARDALTWLRVNLQDPQDKLVWDQLEYKQDGSKDINRTKWTYNSGFAIHAFTLYYEATGDKIPLEIAIEIAKAAMNPEGPLFDHCIPDPSQRMLSDGSFFLHHLVDGYLALSKHALTEKLRNEILLIASWGRTFMLDPKDGLYYRGNRPYAISEHLAMKFNQKFGTSMGLEINHQERDQEGGWCKTMLGCASWARILHAAELVEESISREKNEIVMGGTN